MRKKRRKKDASIGFREQIQRGKFNGEGAAN